MSGLSGHRMALFAAAVVALGVCAFAIVASGAINVSAVPPHNPVVGNLLHYTFRRSVAQHSVGTAVPDDIASPGRIALGAQHYDRVCARCHGAPGLGQSPVALSMRPSPQYLPAVVDQFDDAELHWIVQNGVRFSAMPAWVAPGRSDEVWAMVAFLRQLPQMTAADYLEMTAPAASAAPEMPFGLEVGSHETYMPRRSEPRDEYSWKVPATDFGGAGDNAAPAVTCAACHGTDGRGAPTGGEAPNLTIQSAEYLAATLHAFAEARRSSGFMQPVAAALSDDQITALAAYYSAQPRAAAGPSSLSADTLELGRQIAENGLPSRGISSCLTCHEKPAAPGALPVPHLFGQSETYLHRQLFALANGQRGSTGPYNPMPLEAHALDTDEMAAVSAWLSAQAPRKLVEAVAALPAASMAKAQDLAERVCAKCHGRDLAGTPEASVPNLTLQSAPYLLATLHSFEENHRNAPQMVQTAYRLSPDEITALASYIGGGEPVPNALSADPGAVARGAALALNGSPDRGVPACLTCHGPASTAEMPMIARLNGQVPGYIEARLRTFAGPASRLAEASNPMYQIARTLSPSERADLGAYFSAQPPMSKAR